MKFEIKNTEQVSECCSKVTFLINKDLVSSKLNTKLDQAVLKTKLKGFRPGKAPKEMILKLHGQHLKLETIEESIQQTITSYVTENKIRLVDRADVKIISSDIENDLEFSAGFTVLPEPEIKGYDKLKVETVKKEVTDQELQKNIDSLLQSKTEFVDNSKKKKISKNSFIKGKLLFHLDGEPTPEEEGTFDVSSEFLPKELREKLLDSSLGDNFIIPIEYVDKLPKEWKDKKIEINFTPILIQDKKVPEFNDEFIKNMDGTDAETVKDYKAELKASLEKHYSDLNKSNLKSAVFSALASENDFFIPQAMIDDEMRHLIFSQGIVDPKKVKPEDLDLDLYREKFSDNATQRVKNSLIINQLTKKIDVKVEQSDIDKKYEELSEKYNIDSSKIKEYYENSKGKNELFYTLTEDKLVDKLLETAEVSYTNE